MPDENIIPFPAKLHNAVDEEGWRLLQGEFYLDCFHAYKGHSVEDPEQLRVFLQEAEITADLQNPFFRGWLVRRLSEDNLL